MKNYIIYARKSSEADDKQVQSIGDQLAYCHKRIDPSEWRLLATFTEEKSAKKPGIRTAFYEMLELAEKTENVVIVSWKLNRLSRNPVDSGTVQYALQNDKISSIITSDRTYQKEDSGLMFSVESGMWNQFIIDLSKDTKRGMAWKAKDWWLGWPAPQGYLNDIFHKTILIDPERFLTVRRMWDLLLKEKYSLSRIANIANDEWWFRTRMKQKIWGKPIGVSSLYHIFTNPFYAWMIRFKWVVSKWNHEPMITLEEFHLAQMILGKNTSCERPQKREFAYTGSIKCGCCGCSITAEQRTKKNKVNIHNYIYYHCSHKKDTPIWKCSERSAIQDINLEGQILDILGSIEIIPDFVDWAKWVLHRLHWDESKKIESTFESMSRQIEWEKKKLSKLFDYLINETISESQYKEQKQKMESEIELLEAKRQSSGVASKNWMEVMEDTLDFIKTARAKFITWDIQTKKKIFRALGSNLILMEGKLTLELNSWFKPFENINSKLTSPLWRFEPYKKSISLRETNALDVDFSIWLPVLEEVRENILSYSGTIYVPKL